MFFKIDVEGLEPMVFHGMYNVLKTNKKITIVFEFSPYAYTEMDLETIFNVASKFDIFKINDVEGTFKPINVNELSKINNQCNILLTNDKNISSKIERL